MLTPSNQKPIGTNIERFAIVASKYNARYVDGMVNAARKVLAAAGVKQVRRIRVPGAFEIPIVAAKLAAAYPPYGAIICLGVILRGETTHAQNISEAVGFALADIQVKLQVPVIHEVLLLENEAQAKVRCLSSKHNRGAEAAQTAIEMANVMKLLART